MSLQRGLKRRRRWRNSCSSGNRCPLALPRTCVKLNAHNPTSLSPSTRKTLCSQSYKRQRLHNPPPAPSNCPREPKTKPNPQTTKESHSLSHSHSHSHSRFGNYLATQNSQLSRDLPKASRTLQIRSLLQH